MSNLSDWAEVIRQQAEERQREQDELNARLEAEMPAAIERLPKHTNEGLLELFVQFLGGRLDIRETQLRQQFADEVRKEILRRMTNG